MKQSKYYEVLVNPISSTLIPHDGKQRDFIFSEGNRSIKVFHSSSWSKAKRRGERILRNVQNIVFTPEELSRFKTFYETEDVESVWDRK